MKLLALTLGSALIAGAATAQQTSPFASPIPDGAESRFCYYAGLAYSVNSYVILTGSNVASTTSGDVEERLLECVPGDNGVLRWHSRSQVKFGN